MDEFDNNGPAKMSSKPDPDPTVATTAQLLREIRHLKEFVATRFEVVDTRFNGMDKAMDLLQRASDKVPSETDIKVANLKQVQDQRFNSIDLQFQERDIRTKQSTESATVAVGAALQAAKEAVGKQQESNDRAIAKSEASTTKQIDQLGVLIASLDKTLSEKIDDTKKRLSVLDGRGAGLSSIGALVMVAVAIVSAVVLIANYFSA